MCEWGRQAALKEMVRPAVLALASPVAIGVMAKTIGSLQGVDNLAPEVLASFMMFASMTGLLLAVMLDNAGGAWDNAKKYVETGQHGGKVSHLTVRMTRRRMTCPCCTSAYDISVV